MKRKLGFIYQESQITPQRAARGSFSPPYLQNVPSFFNSNFFKHLIVMLRLKRMEECNTYLTHVCIHHCSIRIMVKAPLMFHHRLL